ncbi:TPA: tRNA pseudouridine(54/55) synthase Pus10 [Thermoplasmata archaeon]|nr:tRNA pseudouridine(54/55) synthase Pus10 [Thermoplasmata archaeon]
MSRRLEIAGRALERPLCNHCLGRLFAAVSRGLSNEQRGVIVRFVAPKSHPVPPTDDCHVCHGLFSEVPKFAGLVEKVSMKYEHATFLVGSKIDPSTTEREEQLWTDSGATETETIKGEVNREIGKLVEGSLGKTAEFKNPDVVYLVDTMFDRVTANVTPLFVYGRYRKFVRDLPQTRWPCRECRGKGCPRCEGRGKMYESSVQELIGPILVRFADGEEDFFHGMGREDIDARMLGNGRPFVAEVRRPRKRSFDLAGAMAEINALAEGRIEVEGLRFSTRDEVRAIKDAASPKTYRVRVRFQQDFDHRKLNDIVRVLAEKPICQLTPNRVAHRRADLERVKTVRRIEVESVEGPEVVFVVEADSGTYIKELMHGDGGRTEPNVAGIVGVPCEVAELDVIWIGDKGA